MNLLYIWACGKINQKDVQQLFDLNPDKKRSSYGCKTSRDKKRKLHMHDYLKIIEDGYSLCIYKHGYVMIRANAMETLKYAIVKYKINVNMEKTKFIYYIKLSHSVDVRGTKKKMLNDTECRFKYRRTNHMIDAEYKGFNIYLLRNTARIRLTMYDNETEVEKILLDFIKKFAVPNLPKLHT